MAAHEPSDRSTLSQHILPSSATMVGECITALSILKLVRPTGLGIWVNHLLAFSSLVFLTSGMLSYAAMRAAQNVKLKRYADVAFIAGLLLLSLCTVFMALVIQ
jgi:multisubunit Na+/H+ antiporter MnhG subunit